METRPPTAGRVLIAVGFAISCFGLLLFLWLAFGGPVPLKSKSYRVTVPFTEATQLAVESDVRISGVSVGKVKGIQLSDTGNYADAEVQIDPQYAPIPSNTKAILRQKTLLGETYVELTPGDPSKGMLPEDGDAARRPGLEGRAAGRDLPHLQREDQDRVPGLDAGRRCRPAWPRCRPQRGARQPHRRSSNRPTT